MLCITLILNIYIVFKCDLLEISLYDSMLVKYYCHFITDTEKNRTVTSIITTAQTSSEDLIFKCKNKCSIESNSPSRHSIKIMIGFDKQI